MPVLKNIAAIAKTHRLTFDQTTFDPQRCMRRP